MNSLIRSAFVLIVAPGLALGCGDDSTVMMDASTDSSVMSDGSPDGSPDGSVDASPDGSTDGSVDGGGDAGTGAHFRLRIENATGGGYVTPLSPGVWVLHSDPDPLFMEGSADYGDGLENIAEDADPSTLAAALPSGASGVFNMPMGATDPGPILPGDAYEIDITATPDMPNLSFASMVGQSNDVFVAPNGDGIPLFDSMGNPLAERDVTDMIALWNAGTEIDEAPHLGPDQAPRQSMPGQGATEGVVRAFSDNTRAIPLPADIIGISVSESSGDYTITIDNVSGDRGTLVSPISPVFYALHDDTVAVFAAGTPDDGMGLEDLAEQGNPSTLVTSYTGASGVLMAGAMAIPVGDSSAGPATPGKSYALTVTPDSDHPLLTIATMIGQSNDAFLGFSGLALLDSTGAPRPAAEVEAEMRKMIAVWDAGTEANEVPGVGPNQAPRQAAPGDGAADPDDNVRLYDDSTNDLAGAMAGGFVDLTITHTSGMDFQVQVTNTSDGTAYPGVLGPMFHAVHDDTASLFTEGMPASAGLQKLAEDGSPADLVTEIDGASGVLSAGAQAMRDGGGSGPIMAGDGYTFTVTMDATHRFLSVASMIVPSNDTFLAFPESGIELVDSTGAVRSDADIATDVAAMLGAWDAGSEQNQASALGADQAPAQSAPNTGAAEGDGTVRNADGAPVWSYPPVGDVVRVTITPLD